MYHHRVVETKCSNFIIDRVQFHQGFLRIILEIHCKVALIYERAKRLEIISRKYESSDHFYFRRDQRTFSVRSGKEFAQLLK